MVDVNLFLKERFNKQTLGVELTTDTEVIPQLYTRKSGVYYEWGKNTLTIRQALGTYKTSKIENIVKTLFLFV